MMEAAPSPTFKMPETDLLLELLVVALNAPTQLGEVNQTVEGGVRGERRQEVFGRLALAFGPLDQEPFLWARLVAPLVTPRGRPAAQAQRSCSSAISCLVLKPISPGTPALRRRSQSSAHSWGR